MIFNTLAKYQFLFMLFLLLFTIEINVLSQSNVSTNNIIFYYQENPTNDIDDTLLSDFFLQFHDKDQFVYVLFESNSFMVIDDRKFYLSSKDTIIKLLENHISEIGIENDHKRIKNNNLLNSLSSIFNKYIECEIIDQNISSNDIYEFHFIIDIEDLSLLNDPKSMLLDFIHSVNLISLLENNQMNSSIYVSHRIANKLDLNQHNLLSKKCTFNLKIL